ncbi:unnamed protein product [Didymodactylos carnosus]|uniref:TFIIS central domain-containing protein n=1 Tax=Didymodactylos carnosus TaxID=1234261 RepID=A0A813XLT6_9BILA|nr:unnamed protein product [Didymodactylos carnosus]CAF3659059.1 unnamed protein product [Didymodactylos carnosus]
MSTSFCSIGCQTDNVHILSDEECQLLIQMKQAMVTKDEVTETMDVLSDKLSLLTKSIYNNRKSMNGNDSMQNTALENVQNIAQVKQESHNSFEGIMSEVGGISTSKSSAVGNKLTSSLNTTQQKISVVKKNSVPSSPPIKPAIIRAKVRLSLNDILIKRSNQARLNGYTSESIKQTSVQIENEIYRLFGNTNEKYRQKSRQILFAIKNENNKLFAQIVNKEVDAKHLVEMKSNDYVLLEAKEHQNLAIIQVFVYYSFLLSCDWTHFEQITMFFIEDKLSPKQEDTALPKRSTMKCTRAGLIDLETKAQSNKIIQQLIPKKSTPKPTTIACSTVIISPIKKKTIHKKSSLMEKEPKLVVPNRGIIDEQQLSVIDIGLSPSLESVHEHIDIPLPPLLDPIDDTFLTVLSMDESKNQSRVNNKTSTDEYWKKQRNVTDIKLEKQTDVNKSFHTSDPRLSLITYYWHGIICRDDTRKCDCQSSSVYGSNYLCTNIPNELSICGHLKTTDLWPYIVQSMASDRDLLLMNITSTSVSSSLFNRYLALLCSTKYVGVAKKCIDEKIENIYLIPVNDLNEFPLFLREMITLTDNHIHFSTTYYAYLFMCIISTTKRQKTIKNQQQSAPNNNQQIVDAPVLPVPSTSIQCETTNDPRIRNEYNFRCQLNRTDGQPDTQMQIDDDDIKTNEQKQVLSSSSSVMIVKKDLTKLESTNSTSFFSKRKMRAYRGPCPLIDNAIPFYLKDMKKYVDHLPCPRRTDKKTNLFDHLENYHKIEYKLIKQILTSVMNNQHFNIDKQQTLPSVSRIEDAYSKEMNFNTNEHQDSLTYKGKCPLKEYCFGISDQHKIRLCHETNFNNQTIILYPHLRHYHHLSSDASLKLIKAIEQNRNKYEQIFKSNEWIKK